MTPPASSHTYLGLYNVGLRAGLFPFDDPEGIVFSAGFQAQIARIEPQLRAVLLMDGWINHFTDEIHPNPYTTDRYEYNEKTLDIALPLIYDLPPFLFIKPFLGFGPAVQVKDNTVEYTYISSPNDSVNIYSESRYHRRIPMSFIYTLVGLEASIYPRMSVLFEFDFLTDPDYYGLFAGVVYRFKD